MAEVLKTFAAKITTSKLTERRKILGDLAACVARPGECLELGGSGDFFKVIFLLLS